MISLSNLVKQSLVRGDPGKKLVINSNRRIEKRLLDYQRQQEELSAQEPEQEFLITESESGDAEDGEGFTEGLSAPTITEEQASVLLEEARQRAQETANAEAEMILAQAREEAQKLLAEAGEEAERLREEKQQEGYTQGVDNGRREMEDAKAALERDYSRKTQALEEEFRRKQKELEPELVDAIIQVFDRVFSIQFEDKRPILLSLVENTLGGIETGKSFRIHVSEANRAFLESHIEDMKAKLGNDVEIEVSADPSVEDSACTIETDYGIFDCGIDVELSNLIRDIRSLSYE